jgi:ribose transport system substrate-binding protein
MPSTINRSMRSEASGDGSDRAHRAESQPPWRPERRDVIRLAASIGTTLTGGFLGSAIAATADDKIRRSRKPLRAAFSNIGLQVSWCAQGKAAAEFWGKLFSVDVTWFDPGLSATQQLAAAEEIASGDWDFVAIQAVEINTLSAPVTRMIDAGIPVIDMDTLIAPLDQIGVHTFLAPDNEFMGAAVTQALVDAIGGTGTIIMTQGALGHSGAQGRTRGFESVIARSPNIQVLATEPADWDPAKTRQLWESYLDKFPQIGAAFFHNDDMALAALEVIRAKNRTGILIGGIDAMPPAIRAVLDGSMHATVRNSSCRIHGGAIVAGAEAALAPKKAPAAPPKQVVIDGPIVTRANAPGLLWMEDHFLI